MDKNDEEGKRITRLFDRNNAIAVYYVNMIRKAIGGLFSRMR